MDKTLIIMTIFVAALITFSLRAVPFVIFRKGRSMPQKLEYLGKILPSAIMAVLIVYCLKDVAVKFYPDGIAKIIAVFVVIVSYKWKHNTLLSILLGTACNMLLMRLF